MWHKDRPKRERPAPPTREQQIYGLLMLGASKRAKRGTGSFGQRVRNYNHAKQWRAKMREHCASAAKAADQQLTRDAEAVARAILALGRLQRI